MGIYSELEGLNLPQLLELWKLNSPDGKEYENSYFQELANKICATGNEGIQTILSFLQENISDISESVRASSSILGLSSYPEVLEQNENLFSFALDHPTECIQFSAITFYLDQNIKIGKERILQKITHQSPYVRSGVLRYMSRFYTPEAHQLLIDALKDPSYIVRESAVDELDESDHGFEAGTLKEILQPLINDPHPHVRQAVITALSNLG